MQSERDRPSASVDNPVTFVEDSPPADDVNQVMIVDSSMETVDGSPERVRNVERGRHDENQVTIKRYTVTRTTMFIEDIRVESIVDGVVVNSEHYKNERVVDKKVEKFEESGSSLSNSVVSSSSSRCFADVSGSGSDERTDRVVARIEVGRGLQKEFLTDRRQNAPRIFSPFSSNSDDSFPREFPRLGISPKKNESLETFKFPSSRRAPGQHRHKSSARFSTSTSISGDDRLSFIPVDISSIRQSMDASMDPPFPPRGEKSSLIDSNVLERSEDLPAVEPTSPSLIGKLAGGVSSDLFSNSEAEKEAPPGAGGSRGCTTDVIPPTESDVSQECQSGKQAAWKRLRRARLPIKRYSMIRRRLSTIVASPALGDSTERGEVGDHSRSLRPGVQVYVRWTDSHYYPGCIRRVNDAEEDDTGKLTVLFDDGHLHEAARVDVIVCELIPMNSSVMAQRGPAGLQNQSTPGMKGRDWSEVAEVVGHARRVDGKVSYIVRFNDGEESCLERAKVTLSMTQAKRIFGSLIKSLEFQRTLNLSPDVSQENLLEGKRKRRPTTPLAQNFESGSMTSPKRKRTFDLVKGVCSTTRMKKRKYTHTKEKVKTFDPCPPVVICTPSARRLPAGRSAKRALDLDLPSNPKSQIFAGLTFLITHTLKSANQLRMERKMWEGETFCDSQLDAVDADVMNRDAVVDLIVAGGGNLLEDFTLTAVLSCKEACYLISDSPQRTIKYLCCLAAGIPCVSHQWILSSCKQDKLDNYRLYLLPVGYSIEKNIILSRDHHWTQCSPLRDLHVLIYLRDDPANCAWKKVLSAAGCIVSIARTDESLENHLKNLPKKSSGNFLITSTVLSEDRRTAVERGGVTVVSTEWVVQCLVNGRLIDACEKYRP